MVRRDHGRHVDLVQNLRLAARIKHKECAASDALVPSSISMLICALLSGSGGHVVERSVEARREASVPSKWEGGCLVGVRLARGQQRRPRGCEVEAGNVMVLLELLAKAQRINHTNELQSTSGTSLPDRCVADCAWVSFSVRLFARSGWHMKWWSRLTIRPNEIVAWFMLVLQARRVSACITHGYLQRCEYQQRGNWRR